MDCHHRSQARGAGTDARILRTDDGDKSSAVQFSSGYGYMLSGDKSDSMDLLPWCGQQVGTHGVRPVVAGCSGAGPRLPSRRRHRAGDSQTAPELDLELNLDLLEQVNRKLLRI